jgi:hypothetical protein
MSSFHTHTHTHVLTLTHTHTHLHTRYSSIFSPQEIKKYFNPLCYRGWTNYLTHHLTQQHFFQNIFPSWGKSSFMHVHTIPETHKGRQQQQQQQQQQHQRPKQNIAFFCIFISEAFYEGFFSLFFSIAVYPCDKANPSM